MSRRVQNRRNDRSNLQAESAPSGSIATSPSPSVNVPSDDNLSLNGIPDPNYIDDVSSDEWPFLSLAETSPQSRQTLPLSEYFERLRAETSTSGVHQTADGRSLSGNATAESATTFPLPSASRYTSTLKTETENLLSSYDIAVLQEDASKVASRNVRMAKFCCVFSLLRQCMRIRLRNYQDYTLRLNDKEALWDDGAYLQMIPPRNQGTNTRLAYALRTMARIILVLNKRYNMDSREVEGYKKFQMGRRNRLSADIKKTESTWSDQHEPFPNLWHRLQTYWLSFQADTETGRQMAAKYQRSFRARQAVESTGLGSLDSEFSNDSELTLQMSLQASPKSLLNILKKRLADMQAASNQASQTQQTHSSPLDMGIIIKRLGLTGDHISSLQEVVMPLIQKRIAEDQEGASLALLGFLWTVLSGQLCGRLADPTDSDDEEHLFGYWIQVGSEWLKEGWSVSQLDTFKAPKSELSNGLSGSESEEEEYFDEERAL